MAFLAPFRHFWKYSEVSYVLTKLQKHICSTVHAATKEAPPTNKSEDLFIVGTIKSVEYNGINALIYLEDEGCIATLLKKDEKYVKCGNQCYGMGPVMTSTPKDSEEESFPGEINVHSTVPDTHIQTLQARLQLFQGQTR